MIGTGANTTTWSSWSVPGGGQNFSDEAVWVLNASNTGNSLEGGFYSGWGPQSGFTNGMLPYYTTGNGTGENDGVGKYLSANTGIWLNVTSAYNGSGGFVGVGPYSFTGIQYTISSPAQNAQQGETTASNIWMGGGSGETFNAKWENTSRNFYSWGFNNPCVDSPYSFNSTSGSSFSNGGY